MTTSSIAARVETWLSSAWHIKVPLTWLEACINWIQEENSSSSSNLSQAQINKQVFEQWLLTDLRDLEHPILPDCVLDDPKGELSGFFSIQIDSLVDVSQPAYSQLQKLRGKSTVNEEVTANTQSFPKPWEAKPSRMLMLQLTDGVHQIQGMEYQPVPALHSNLPPGTKITVQGKVAYRLGVLLLKPENVKLLGGEVDALLEEYSQERVLARLIGEAENPNPVGRTDHEQVVPRPVDELGQALGPSDEELLASLEENNDFTLNNETHLESGYYSRSSNFSTALGSHNGNVLQQESPGPFPHLDEQIPHPVEYADGFSNDFPLEDDLLLEEEIQRELEEVPPEVRNLGLVTESLSRMSRSSCDSPFNSTYETDGKNEREKCVETVTQEKSWRRRVSPGDENRTNNTSHCSSVHQINSCANLSLDSTTKERLSDTHLAESRPKPQDTSQGRLLHSELHSEPVCSSETEPAAGQQQHDIQTCARSAAEVHHLDLCSPPFTYISVLLAKKPETVTILKAKCFIVTLTGKLTSSNGSWGIKAKISDGSALLEVDFADDILTSLIGFSVAEMNVLKKDPASRAKLKDGLEKCQRQLIDLCCLMTIEFNPFQSKATVLVLEDADARHLEQLKKRLYK